MLYPASLIYLFLVFFRPTEVFNMDKEIRLVLWSMESIAPLLAYQILRNPRHLIATPQDRLLLGFFFMMPFSCLVIGWAGGVVQSLSEFGVVVFMYVLLRYALREEQQWRTAVWLLIAIMTMHALSGVVQYFGGVGLGGVTPMFMQGAYRIRGVGIFDDPNDLGLALVVFVPYLVVGALPKLQAATAEASGAAASGENSSMPEKLTQRALRHMAARRKRGVGAARFVPTLWRIFVACLLLVMVAAMFFTNSRGAMISLALALGGVMWRRYGARIALAFMVVGVAGLLAVGPSRVSDMDDDEDSAQGRIQAWGEGIQMLKSNPLSGVGYDQFTEHHDLVAHNSYIHVFGELGLPGGTFFVGMVVWYFLSLNRSRAGIASSTSPQRHWHDAVEAAGVGFFSGIFFLSRQYNPVFYLVLALGVCHVSILQGAAMPALIEQKGDRLKVLGWALAMLLFIYAIVLVGGRYGGG